MGTKALNLLTELEQEYGSVAKVPEGNPKLEELRKLLNEKKRSGNRDIYGRVIRWSTVELVERIKKLRDKGYTLYQIAAEVQKTPGYVKSLLIEHNIKLLPIYKYKLTDQNGTVMYLSSHGQATSVTGLKVQMVGKLFREERLHKGFQYRNIRPIAVNLPKDVLILKDGKWQKVK